jgi:hypothetical protein
MKLTLIKDVTAADLAIDSWDGDEGYPADYVIGPAGTTVHLVEDCEDGWIEVRGFANDPYVEGFVPSDILKEEKDLTTPS